MNFNNKFYKKLEQALQSDDIDSKSILCTQLLEYCSKNESFDQTGYRPKIFKKPSYASICEIVSPKELPTRNHFDTTEGLGTLVHAIAHIEFSAIDLAFDAVYRFPDMPAEYKYDWLIVADDEIRHFRMLTEVLHTLGYKYGDFAVHQGLFDASSHTVDDVIERMAVIPRHYEASGLDVNPQIIKKLANRAKDPIVASIIKALNVILDEEIDHVRKGDRWFRWLCEQRGVSVSSEFIRILDKYDLRKKHRPHMNIEARKEAGFACEELLELGAKDCE